MLNLSKKTSPQKLFDYGCVTLYLSARFGLLIERIESLRFLRSSEVTLGQGLLKKGGEGNLST